MQFIPKARFLEHHPDTLVTIRKEYKLDKPGTMQNAIRIIREWVQAQKHFKKKDFSDVYLETLIISCKGSLERSKQRLDRMCTLRTLLPQFFEVRNVKTDFGNLFDIMMPVVLPKLTPDHYRVIMVKAGENIHLIKNHLDYFAFCIMMGDYMKIHDYCRGFIIIVDFTEMNVMDFLSNTNAVQIRQAFTILILVSSKVADRIHSYKSLENLTDIVPADILPQEYGGKERPLKTLRDEWLEVLSSEENLSYLKDLSGATTDESCRQTDKFNDEYLGMPGTFRVLTVD